MSVRTRDKLIESAKTLFIRNGVENTTISDIANASDKGRRTIYTYFKNKLEIYRAVIERESEIIASEMRAVAATEESVSEKMRTIIRMMIVKSANASSSYSNIKVLLGMKSGRTEKATRIAWEKTAALIGLILDQGIESGEFDSDMAERVRVSLPSMLRALSAAGEDPADAALLADNAAAIITRSLQRHPSLP